MDECDNDPTPFHHAEHNVIFMNREKKLPAVVMKKVMKKTVVMKKPVVTC